MDDPAREVSSVIESLLAAPSPDRLNETLQQYYTSDAAFEHPLCRVASRPQSIKAIANIYLWYHTIADVVKTDVKSVAFDEANSRLYLDVTRIVNLRITPFKPVRLRLIIVLNLAKGRDGKLRIRKQEDLYQPESLALFGLPGSSSLVLILKHTATFACNVAVQLARTVGMFR
ncbi:uncharacterized protein L969DRAFT_91377 [Mixia osmundae IAM 14324]|uniref:SigF-like NTF2-like domain-containing protein n=1 Tax=Mixia osmundae (strain CBS 9802 / IAM 14324 / JCM 22182 / KY 12970) TaxID=764103 RepID=G7E791_MIXOS|nr:uncharacterized protein L969DRAFT_91377 [Mixia osmundae IAM 14324]KEI41905.1 hypothetical protein L969DRAFT_91377 [Mixia osmundae IAM 14324]GAA98701.1 hypothetical protein E5Q_05389 [Mixia osmundae IAM 14324]